MTRSLGWNADPVDGRDLLFAAPRDLIAAPQPRTADLSPGMPPVYDQGSIGACTGHAGAALGQYALRAQGLPEFTPSRLDLYYQARKLEGTQDRDAGAFLRDTLKIMGQLGMPPESLWPYDVTQFAVAPPPLVMDAGLKRLATKYLSVQANVNAVKVAILSGYPVAFGFVAYPGLQSFLTSLTGNLPMPSFGQRPIGGHAAVINAYDDGRKKFKIRNSWGPSWGQKGHFWMSYAYFEQFASDCWVVEAITP